MNDYISRQAVLDDLEQLWDMESVDGIKASTVLNQVKTDIKNLPSAQPKRKWTPCNNPPKHHKDVIVRGIEAIGNVTVHKVMQWDVDTWRPTNYAPSIIWKEWSEI